MNPHRTLHELLATHTNVETLTVLANKSTNEQTRRVAEARLAELEAMEADMWDSDWMQAPEFP